MSSGVCWGSRQPWGAAAAALGRRCCPVTPLPGSRGFFPQNRKFILCAVRVYTLFLNREFPKLGIGSASKWRYVYTQENPNKYFLLLLAVYVLRYMTQKLTSAIFLVPSRASKGQRARKGNPMYCHQTSQAGTGYVSNSCELFTLRTVLQADDGELIFLTLWWTHPKRPTSILCRLCKAASAFSGYSKVYLISREKKISTQLFTRNSSPQVDCRGTGDVIAQVLPSLFNDYLHIMHVKIIPLP